MDISIQALQEAVSIRRQIDTLQKRLSTILAGSRASSAPAKGGRRPMPAATRAKLAAAARARWARIKGQTKATACREERRNYSCWAKAAFPVDESSVGGKKERCG